LTLALFSSPHAYTRMEEEDEKDEDPVKDDTAVLICD
jgi:hypothetical protein